MASGGVGGEEPPPAPFAPCLAVPPRPCPSGLAPPLAVPLFPPPPRPLLGPRPVPPSCLPSGDGWWSTQARPPSPSFSPSSPARARAPHQTAWERLTMLQRRYEDIDAAFNLIKTNHTQVR